MINYENLYKLNNEFTEDFKKAFDNFLESGWYILGNGVEKFEEEFATYHGVNHCIGVASGLDALILSIAAFNFPANSEIIVPANTYIATIIAILRAGMKPILVEPHITSYNINVNLIENAITSKTVAILPVHLYGKPCNMDQICHIASKFHLEIIEDCAQAHGAKYNNQLIGTFGVGAFSFYPTKNLGALGDAGAIITNNDDIAKKLRSLRNYGSSKKYHFDYTGYNSRLDELQAMMLSIKLKKLDKINDYKRMLAKTYFSKISDHYILPCVDDECYDVYHIFNIRLKNREKLQAYLLKNDIKTEVHYPIPPHKQKAFTGYFNNINLPISEEIHKTTLSLPISYSNTLDDINIVIDALNNFAQNYNVVLGEYK